MVILAVLSILVAMLAVWRPIYSLWLVIGAAVLQDDKFFYETALLRDLAPLPTVFNTRLIGLHLIDWYVLLLLASGAVALWRRSAGEAGFLRRAMSGRVVLLLGAATVPFVLSFALGIYRGNPWLEAVQDLQNHLYLLVMATVVASIVPDLGQLRRTIKLLMAALSVKTLILLLRYVLGVGVFWERVLRVTLSSDTVLLLVLLATTLIYLARPTKGHWNCWGMLAISSAAYFILFETSGRTIMLLFAAQVCLLFLLVPPRQRLGILAVLLAWNSILALYLFGFDRPLAQFYWWRIKSIFWWSPDQLGRDGIPLSNAVKALEIRNVTALLARERAMIFGLGQGSFWQDVFYPIKLPYYNDGYAPGEVRHFSTHLLPLTQLLKMGVAGVAVYWAAIFGLLVTSVRKAVNPVTPYADLYRIVSLSLVPLLFNMSAYVRLSLFLGIVVGVMLWLELWGGMRDETGHAACSPGVAA